MKPNTNWTSNGGEAFAIHYNDNDKFYQMTACGDGLYKYEGYDFINHPSICFTRHSASAVASEGFNWNPDTNLWNQTKDLTYPTSTAGEFTYTIAEGAWSKDDGSWNG